jgi:hypothetical protein
MPAPLPAPWRSVRLPQAITLIALAVGLPLFLRSPPWCDITLYQMAARNIVNGGIHYEHIFDTNLPGFVWVVAALYRLFGPNVIALRAVDLTIVLGIVLLLDLLAKWGGATRSGRWWAIAAAAVFYPFTVEMSHAQRDVWMTLPALAAVALRLRRATSDGPDAPSSLRPSFREGLLWGLGVWLKPHVALMALCVWLLTAWRLAGERPRPWRALGADLLGNLLGGLAVGALGLLWMHLTGALGPFIEVFAEWNPYYVKLAKYEFPSRVEAELYWFPPWSLWLVVTAPLAALSLLDAAPWLSRGRAAAYPSGWLGRRLPAWLWDAEVGSDARFVRGIVGGLYLVWAWQAFYVQRAFEYAHVPETLLMVCIWATHRWAWVPVVFVWLAVTSGVWLAAGVSPGVQRWLDDMDPVERRNHLPRHTLANPDRLRLWPQCWRLMMPNRDRYALWDALRQHPPHEASPSWSELYEVAEFLRAQNVTDGEVIAWFDSPHAVYLMLDIDPAFRYMHVHTVIAISVGDDPTSALGRKWVLDGPRYGLKRAGHPNYRYVIGDLEWAATSAGLTGKTRDRALGPPCDPANGKLLPALNLFPTEFPFNQPTVFRTRGGLGRYVVHRFVNCDDDPGASKR